MTVFDHTTTRFPWDPPAPPPAPKPRMWDAVTELASTLGWLAASMGLAAGCWWVLGPPRLPTPLPTLEQVRTALAGSELPAPVVIEGGALIVWGITGYLLVVLSLRLIGSVALMVFGAGRAVRRLTRLIDLVTLPPLRRLSEGALAGVVMTSAWLAPPAKARATTVSRTPALPPPPAPALPVETIVTPVWRDSGEAVAFRMTDAAAALLPRRMAVTYTVVRGDTLWQIAARLYGDGHRYPEIMAANAEREVAPGERLTQPHRLQPGWELLVPLPAEHVELTGAGLSYVVQPEDSLWGIAARLLGDGARWLEIWNLNHGKEMGGGQRFTTAGIVRPGWTLRLPPAPLTPAPDAPAEAAPAPVPAAPPAAGPVAPSTRPAPAVTAARPVGHEALPSPALPAPPIPAPATTPDEADDPAGRRPDGRLAAVAVAGAAVAASGALIVAHRRRAGGPTGTPPPRTSRPRGSRRRVRTGGPPTGDLAYVSLVIRLVLEALAEQGLPDVRALTCREAPDEVTVWLACLPGDADAVAGSRFALGRQLGCVVTARRFESWGVELTLGGLRWEAAALVAAAGRSSAPCVLVPAGADDGAVCYLDLTSASAVTVSGSEVETAGLLRTWLATLAATATAGDAAVAVTATRSDLARLVASSGVPCWPDDRSAAGVAADAPRGTTVQAALEVELARRLSGAMPLTTAPLIVALIAAAAGDGGWWETLAARGQAARIVPVIVWSEADGDPPDADVVADRTVRIRFAGAASAAEAAGTLTLTLAGLPSVTLRPVAAPGDARISSAEQTTAERTPAERTAPHQLALPDAVAKAPADEEPPAGQSAGEPCFAVRCLGEFAVELAGTPLLEWKSQKARELLAFLVAHGDVAVAREDAWAALWPDGKPARMQKLLSTAASNLRRSLRDAAGQPDLEPLITQDAHYRLRWGLFRIDLTTLDARLRRAARLQGVEALIEYERALALCRGRLFGGEPFDWADGRRQAYEQQFLTTGHTAARLALECRDVERAISLYELVLLRDPLDEAAARELMRCHAGQGDINGARKVYKALVKAVRREFGEPAAEPMPETVLLMQELLQGQAHGRPGHG